MEKNRKNREHEAILHKHRLLLSRKRGTAIVGVDFEMNSPKGVPSVLRIPMASAWYAIRLIVRTLGFELSIEPED